MSVSVKQVSSRDRAIASHSPHPHKVPRRVGRDTLSGGEGIGHVRAQIGARCCRGEALLPPCSGNPFPSRKERKALTRFSVPFFLPLWPFYCSCLTAAIKRNMGRRVSSCHSGC